MEVPARKPIIIPERPVGAAPELPPGTTRWGTDMEKYAAMERDLLSAASGTPTIVNEALSPKAISFGGREMHDFTVQSYLNLAALKSPFIDRKEGEPLNPVMPQFLIDLMRALWAMTTPDEDVRRAIAKGGEYLEDKIAAFAAQIPMVDLAGGSAAIDASISGGFAPAAKMNPPEREGGGAPLSEASSATASGGP